MADARKNAEKHRRASAFATARDAPPWRISHVYDHHSFVSADGKAGTTEAVGGDVVFTCPEGRDYCSACRARLPKRPGGLVKTTAGARLAAAAAAESDDDDD